MDSLLSNLTSKIQKLFKTKQRKYREIKYKEKWKNDFLFFHPVLLLSNAAKTTFLERFNLSKKRMRYNGEGQIKEMSHPKFQVL